MMKWRTEQRGQHTHVTVFMHGANCGKLCFRNEEFNEIITKNVQQRMAGMEPLIVLEPIPNSRGDK